MLPLAASVLEARGLSVGFADSLILDEVDLCLEAGEIAVIEGSSGSGKSTLLRALALLEPAKRGALRLHGVDAHSLPPATYRTAVAYIPQLPVMFEGTVTDNLQAGPRLRGQHMAEAEVHGLLDRVGLSRAFASRFSRDLSGGEKQRVAIARALANQPTIVLFDEPTSALDPAAATSILSLARAIAGEGRAVVVVTHVHEHAAALGGTRYLCHAGKLTRQP